MPASVGTNRETRACLVVYLSYACAKSFLGIVSNMLRSIYSCFECLRPSSIRIRPEDGIERRGKNKNTNHDHSHEHDHTQILPGIRSRVTVTLSIQLLGPESPPRVGKI